MYLSVAGPPGKRKESFLQPFTIDTQEGGQGDLRPGASVGVTAGYLLAGDRKSKQRSVCCRRSSLSCSVERSSLFSSATSADDAISGTVEQTTASKRVTMESTDKELCGIVGSSQHISGAGTKLTCLVSKQESTGVKQQGSNQGKETY